MADWPLDDIVALLPRLRRFALTLTRHEDDADDLTQATVEKALLRADSWRPETRLDSWLFKIMQNHWIDQTRARASRGGTPVDLDGVPDPTGEDGRQVTEVRRQLRAALEAVLVLPDEQRLVVGLVLIEGLPYRDADWAFHGAISDATASRDEGLMVSATAKSASTPVAVARRLTVRPACSWRCSTASRRKGWATDG